MKNVTKFAAISAIAISSILGVSVPAASAAPASAALPAAPDPESMNTLAGSVYHGPYNSNWQCAAAMSLYIGMLQRGCVQHNDGKWWFIASA